MWRTLWLFAAVTCLHLRQPSGLRDTSASRPVSPAEKGGACFGPGCCVKVARAEDGTCALAGDACAEQDSALLEHLELAFVCQRIGEDAYTHHSLGFGVPTGRVATAVECAACFAPRKADFVFQTTLRHAKRRHSDVATAAAAVAEADAAAAAAAADATVPESAMPELRREIAGVFPACSPVDAGPFAGFFPARSPSCCAHAAQALAALRSPACLNTLGPIEQASLPQVCAPSCFSSLHAQLAAEPLSNEGVCGAWVEMKTGFAMLLNALCSRSHNGTCTQELLSTGQKFAQILASPPAAQAAANASADPTTPTPGDPSSGTVPPDVIVPPPSLLARALRSTPAGAYSALSDGIRHFHAAATEDGWQQVCTPCFFGGASAVSALLEAVATGVASQGVSPSVVGLVAGFVGLNAGDEPARAEDLLAMQYVAQTLASGLCSTAETGELCLAELGDRANVTVGAATCGTRCGKFGGELAVLAKDVPMSQLGAEQALIAGGCGEGTSEYCIDAFWQYIEGLADFHGTVEGWMESCSTATAGGECSAECGEMLAELDAFECCRGEILQGMLLLASRHGDLERWGITERALRPDEEASEINHAIRGWSVSCNRTGWADGCDPCTRQVGLVVAMPQGVSEFELRAHQFPVEKAMLLDIAANVNEPRSHIRILEFVPSDGNVTVVLALHGESCTQADFATATLRQKVSAHSLLLSHTPEAVADLADPVGHVVEFALTYANVSVDGGVAEQVARDVAQTLHVEPETVSIETSQSSGSTALAGWTRASPVKARELDLLLRDGASPLRSRLPQGVLTIQVQVSVAANDLSVSLANRTAQPGFGPGECVHASRQSTSGECVVTTRGCNLDQLEGHEVAFLCVHSDGSKEKHSYGRGGLLGAGVGFAAHEAFHTGVFCDQCLPPPPAGKTNSAYAATFIAWLLLAW